MPESLRLERFSEMICVVFRWQVMPLQEHQIGSWWLLEGFFQSVRWFRGSIREDFIERRVMSWKGRVVTAGTNGSVWEKIDNVIRKKRKGFIVLEQWFCCWISLDQCISGRTVCFSFRGGLVCRLSNFLAEQGSLVTAALSVQSCVAWCLLLFNHQCQ